MLDGGLWLSMMSRSAKRLDLGCDPRVVLNSVITSPNPPAEIKVRGTAYPVTAAGRAERYRRPRSDRLAAGAGAVRVVHRRRHRRHLRRLRNRDRHPARGLLASAAEYVRPQRTQTSLGPPQAVSRLLVPE